MFLPGWIKTARKIAGWVLFMLCERISVLLLLEKRCQCLRNGGVDPTLARCRIQSGHDRAHHMVPEDELVRPGIEDIDQDGTPEEVVRAGVFDDPPARGPLRG